MKKILAQFEKLDLKEKNIQRKRKEQQRTNAFRTVLRPSQSLYFDFVFQNNWLSCSQQLVPAMESRLKIKEKNRATQKFDLTTISTKLKWPNKNFAMTFFRQKGVIEKEKSFYFCNIETYQVLKFQNIKHIDKTFYFQKGFFKLEQAIRLFEFMPKFSVLVVSSKGSFFQLLGDDASLNFDAFQLKMILVLIIICYLSAKGEDNPISRAEQQFIQFERSLKPFQHLQLNFRIKGKCLSLQVQHLIKQVAINTPSLSQSRQMIK